MEPLKEVNTIRAKIIDLILDVEKASDLAMGPRTKAIMVRYLEDAFLRLDGVDSLEDAKTAAWASREQG